MVSKEDSFSMYKVIPPLSEDGRYHVKEYHKDGNLSRVLTFRTVTIDSSVEFHMGSLDGKYIEYDSSGNVLEEGLIINDKKEGEWKEYYPGTTTIRYTGNWVSGQQNGTFYNYYPSGKVKRREFYSYGSLIKGRKFDEQGKKIKFTRYLQMAEPRVNPYRWLMRNLRYPKYEKENKIEGRALVSFVIDKDGSVTDVKALKVPTEGLAKEAIRVIEAMPKWRPFIKDDAPQTLRFTQAVNFQLNPTP